MKGLSVFAFVCGISMFANAVSGQWAFNFAKKSGGYIALDILIGVACWACSAIFWRLHVLRSLRRGLDPSNGDHLIAT